MESQSSELNKTTSPPDKHDHHVPKIENNSDSNSDSDSSTASSPPRHSHRPDNIPKPPTQPPPNQEMERFPTAYRIPPSVFERNKSSTPADWSGASNESLFSIHMGNMSFANNDNYSWRSGELGPPTASTSEQMFCYSAHSSAGGAADMRSRELGLAEATMLEVIKENEARSPPPSASEVRNTRRSAGSNQSNMSFAFSVAGGDTERIPRSASSNQQPTTKPEPHESPDVETPAPKEKEAPKTQSKWLFCFPCCSYCS
ncbi:hypothetical protein C2S51_028835 [Perilla frutescens var. frutescens]|nr:hypothetical protein C2S51_028835 [Perilla frutescens var. frutescens]